MDSRVRVTMKTEPMPTIGQLPPQMLAGESAGYYR